MSLLRAIVIPILLCSLAIVGCSSNNSNSDMMDMSANGTPNDNPYLIPDPSGKTAISRAGYVVARDRTNNLVSGSYLNGLLSIDDYILTNIVRSEDEFDNRQFDCPESGNVVATQKGFSGPRTDMLFANCGINGVELTGSLVRELSSGAIAFGSTASVDWEFNTLEITENGEIATLSGTASRTINTTGGLRGCTGDSGPNISTYFDIDMQSVEIMGATSTTTVTDNKYIQLVRETFVGSVSEPEGPCSPLHYVGFDGTGNIVSTEFGSEIASVQKSGVSVIDGTPVGELLVAGQISGPMNLTVDFNDDSTLDITQPVEVDGKSQVTITSEDVTTSFVDDTFRFDF